MTAVVLALLTREATAADAAAAVGAVEADVVGWVDRFVEAGRAGLARTGNSAGPPEDAEARGRPRSAADLRVENRALRIAVAETHIRAQMWRTAAENTVGPCVTLRRSAKTRRCQSQGSVMLSASRADLISAVWPA
jgi:hypothetical protein